MEIFRTIIVVLGLLVIVTTVLPFLNTPAGWVRVWDFPRPQILFVGAIVIVGALGILVRDLHTERLPFFLALVIVCVGYQGFRIASFSPFWSEQVAARTTDMGSCISILTVNVLQHNRDDDAVRAIIREQDADLVLLLETDRWWTDAVEPALADYTHRSLVPLDNLYGLAFYSRLPSEIETRFLIKEDIPSIKARVTLRNGSEITVYGLHPEPPGPMTSSLPRDGELMMVAKEIRETEEPALAFGDLNDVAWSHTTRVFKRVSRMLDPRVGRGLYASFHATIPMMRWPLDHVFVSRHFTLDAFEVLGSVGSDHFPVYARLCLSPDAKFVNDRQDPADDTDHREVEETIDSAQRDVAEPKRAR